MSPIEAFPPEVLGQRIGLLRSRQGWTQAELAARIAVSRVAISHFEMGLAVPSERTILLLAGLFKVAPLDLVAGTDYPAAKRERLPSSTPSYTELDLQLALLERDLAWLGELQDIGERRRLAADLAARWSATLDELGRTSLEAAERKRLTEAATRLQSVLSHELAPSAHAVL